MTDLEKILEKEVGTFSGSLTLEQKCVMSTAVSLKRIADVLDDGLTHLCPKTGSVFGVADILAMTDRSDG